MLLTLAIEDAEAAVVDGPELAAVGCVAAAARFGSEGAVRDPAVEGSAVSKEAVVGHIEEQVD